MSLMLDCVFIFDFLIEMGANVNALDSRRMSALHYALELTDELYAVKILETGKVDPAVA